MTLTYDQDQGHRRGVP